jgi:hypothetical protein
MIMLTSTALGQDRPIEEGWKGIKVFQTKRADIEKLYAEKPVQSGEAVEFSSDKEVVVVIFSGAPCTLSSKGTILYSFEKDTVIHYGVYLLKPIVISQLNWAKKDYVRRQDDYHSSHVRYINKSTGVDIGVLIDHVSGLEQVIGFRFYPPSGKEFANSCNPK